MLEKAGGLPSRRVGAESPGAWLPAATIAGPRHYPLGVGRVTESGLLLSESAYFLCRSALARRALQLSDRKPASQTKARWVSRLCVDRLPVVD